MKTVLIHSCVQFSDIRPKRCRCKKLITKQQADDLHAEGLAEWRILGIRTYEWTDEAGLVRVGHDVQFSEHELYLNKMKKVPRIDMFSAPDIERAYVDYRDGSVRGERKAQYWIDKLDMEHYEVTLASRAELIVPFKADPFDIEPAGVFKNRSVLFTCQGEERTSVGITRSKEDIDGNNVI